MSFQPDWTQIDPDADFGEETKPVYDVLVKQLGCDHARAVMGAMMETLGGDRYYIPAAEPFAKRQRRTLAQRLIDGGTSDLGVHVQTGLPVAQIKRLRRSDRPGKKAS